MGYNTKFSGSLTLSRKLTLAEAKEFLDANEDPDSIEPAPVIRSYMQWVPSESLDAIVYDGNEKFYDYDKWLQWVLDRLAKMGIVADGSIVWNGESAGDVGVLKVQSNSLTVKKCDMPVNPSAKPLTLWKLGEIALNRLTTIDSLES